MERYIADPGRDVGQGPALLAIGNQLIDGEIARKSYFLSHADLQAGLGVAHEVKPVGAQIRLGGRVDPGCTVVVIAGAIDEADAEIVGRGHVHKGSRDRDLRGQAPARVPGAVGGFSPFHRDLLVGANLNVEGVFFGAIDAVRQGLGRRYAQGHRHGNGHGRCARRFHEFHAPVRRVEVRAASAGGPFHGIFHGGINIRKSKPSIIYGMDARLLGLSSAGQ